ncbi:hypothetical protein PhCBS80983_g04230 [Powellomyces hirtus]|uniref:Fungal lipase-type domain-containing protein n=1 Tax=Powellomyces hirtus TaxID=109895 RepID=A0A507DYJ9_9FUNG|nr:hypothetical protein PhCBS80983_g04230 [Powellomyces hirtus]
MATSNSKNKDNNLPDLFAQTFATAIAAVEPAPTPASSSPPTPSLKHAAALAWLAQNNSPAPNHHHHHHHDHLPVDPRRLPTLIDALLTPPLAKPQNLADLITTHMATVPQTVETIANSDPVVAVSDAVLSGAHAVGDTVGAGVSVVADGVKSVLPFDVDMFSDIAALLVGVLSRNAREIPPLDMGELLLCIGMYCHYQLQKRLDEDLSHKQSEIFKRTPRVKEPEPYERFTYCISFAEAAYEYSPEAVLQKCTKIDSVHSIIDAKYESDEDCPAFFLALDKENWKIVVAIRGTASLHDAIVDLKMDCEPFLGGYAHQGMAHLSHKLLERILPNLTALQRIHPNFDLIITGHSLGAGIASLLTLMLASEPHKNTFPRVRGVCFATPACCTEDLMELAEKYVDSLVLGYDVVPALSEKSLIWLLRELQKFSKTNKHRKLLSEAWNQQLQSVHDALEANPRTKFVVDAWESNVAVNVRNSVGTVATVAVDTIATVSTTAQETAIQVVEAAGDAVVSLHESGYLPAEPTFLYRSRVALFQWLAGLRDDIRETSTMITLGVALTSRMVMRRNTMRFTLFSVSAGVLSQVGYMRWKRYTAQKLELDLAEREHKNPTDRRVESPQQSPKEGGPSHEHLEDLSAATGRSSGCPGDGSAPTTEGELKDLLTPATLYYLHDWAIATPGHTTPNNDPQIETGDVAAAVNEAMHAEDMTMETLTTAMVASDGQELDAETNTNDKSTLAPDQPPPPSPPPPPFINKHVLVRSLPKSFTEITMNVRMIDDHLLSSYRKALDNIVWEHDDESSSSESESCMENEREPCD